MHYLFCTDDFLSITRPITPLLIQVHKSSKSSSHPFSLTVVPSNTCVRYKNRVRDLEPGTKKLFMIWLYTPTLPSQFVKTNCHYRSCRRVIVSNIVIKLVFLQLGWPRSARQQFMSTTGGVKLFSMLHNAQRDHKIRDFLRREKSAGVKLIFDNYTRLELEFALKIIGRFVWRQIR